MAYAILHGQPAVIGRDLLGLFPSPCFEDPLQAVVSWLEAEADPDLKPLFDACFLIYEATLREKRLLHAAHRESQYWDLFGVGGEDMMHIQNGYRTDEEYD